MHTNGDLTRPAPGLTRLAATPQNHMRLWLHAAITRVAAYVSQVGGPEIIPQQFSFLEPYLAEAQQYAPAPLPALSEGWLEMVRQWEAGLPPEAADFPLGRLEASGLTSSHLLALLLIGLVEIDARFGTLYSVLHPFPDEHRLTVGLLDDILRDLDHERIGSAAIYDLHARGLIIIHKLDEPRAARPLSLPGVIWEACGGERRGQPVSGLRHDEAGDFPALNSLSDTFPPEVMRRLLRAPALLDGGLIGGLIMRGMQGSGRTRALGAVARERGQSLLIIGSQASKPDPQHQQLANLCRLAGPLATLLGAMPVIDLELGPGEKMDIPPLPGYQGTLGVVLGLEGGVQGGGQGGLAETCVTLRIPPVFMETRRTHWQRALGDQSCLDEFGRRFHLTIGGIERAGRLAQAYAALEERQNVHMADVQEALRSLNRQSLGALATHIDVNGYTWDSLVAPPSTRVELENLVMRCRQREAVLPHLGAGFRGHNRGVRALFGGPSGTGKTLSARILVAELGLDLYRVDLASVVNKYIGETERNLSKLFARAEELDIVLLLDEGDALLTGRTDVRSSNDRYANLETNYLLQRLESYEGILLVTSNAVSRIDDAFQRRMDVYVEFTPPDATQRYAIWQLHLPPDHEVDDAFLHLVAARCNLSGGQIRNTTLHCSVLAIEHGSPVGQDFVLEAVAREYQKMGATSPLAGETVGL